jgi:hypothetical protein
VKFYVASHFAEKELSKKLAAQITAAGHVCMSRWLTQENLTDPNDHELRQRFALEDAEDVLASDVLVFRNPKESHGKGSGGRRVEFGIAACAGMPILIYGGPSEGVFDDLPNVTICPDHDSLLAKMKELETSWVAPIQNSVLVDRYQKWTQVPAKYPGKGTGSPEAIFYTTLGKIGELGESVKLLLDLLPEVVKFDPDHAALEFKLKSILSDMAAVGERAEGLKKPYRKGEIVGFPTKWTRPFSSEERGKFKKEFGDERWYQAADEEEHGFLSSDVLWENMVKLTRRLKNNTIIGSGSER